MKMSGLDLSSRDSAIRGGTRGAAILPGNSGRSLLFQAVSQAGALKMPPGKALAREELDALREWIDGGAPWPVVSQQAKRSAWWSFQPVVRPSVPKTGSAWPVNSIDAFILHALRAKGLNPSPEADRATLIRRLYFDLTGLPPAAERLQSFVSSKSPKAYEELVDELLSSPQYGEKWGRHWLDLVRYADTAGFELDSHIPDAWRYRDYVIDSFNQDKPYDLFIREQLAGDEVAPEDPAAVTGTGYFCVGPNRDYFPDQSDINRVETLTDYVDTTASVFLGLSAGCARCHDHKFDPIPQRDYYRLQAVFAPAVKTRVPLTRLGSLAFDVAENIREIKLREIGEQIGALEERCRSQVKNGANRDAEIRACLSPAERASLDALGQSLIRLFSNYRAKPFACGVNDVGDYSPKTYLPVRGSKTGEEVAPGFLAVLGGGDIPSIGPPREATGPIPLSQTTGRRRALAEWIARPGNPLTTRVMVNRIWQFHFGRGIAATPSDFGTRGRLPTHPELLDWLASEFVAQGWSMKKMHRLILNSATYRQSANAGVDSASRDPENLYLSHFSRRRLTAEEIRDAVLVSAGTINLRMGGTPVVPPLSGEELFNPIGRPGDVWIVTADKREYTRRSVYLIQKRTFRVPMLEVFDTPDNMLTCPRRESSTTAPQSLTLFNGPFATEQARALAATLVSKHNDDAGLIAAAFRQVLLRACLPAEQAVAAQFLQTQRANTGSREAATAELIRGLFNLNEFLYVD